MSVEFDEHYQAGSNTYTSGISGPENTPTGMLGWLVKRGIHKKQAQYILLIIALVALILSGIILYYSTFKSPPPLSPDQVMKARNVVNTVPSLQSDEEN